jgi:Cysteine rich repeat
LQKYYGTINANNIPLRSWERMRMKKAAIIWGAALLLLSAAPLSAQNDVREACMPDIQKYCSAELGAFSREKVRACLIKNIRKTSPACQAAAKAQRDAERAKKKRS